MNEMGELYEKSDIIIKAQEAFDFLNDNSFLNEESKSDILKSIKNRKKVDYIFITKPFYTCDSLGSSMYNFMRCLQKNLTYVIKDQKKDEN